MPSKRRGTSGGWSPGRLADHIGMSSKFVRAEIALGELRASRFGREFRIADSEVVRYCEKMGWPLPEGLVQPAKSA